MGAFTFGEAAGRAMAGLDSSRRSGAPVRRNSIEAGSFEDGFFVRPAHTTHRTMTAARLFAKATREPGERQGKIGTVALEVLELLLGMAHRYNGRVEPSYEWISEQIHRARSAVIRAVAQLVDSGFLAKVRRFVRIEGAEGPGPRYEQTSNAYRVALPAAAAKLLPRWLKPAPVPEDVLHREQERQEDMQAMLARLTAREFARTVVGGALGDVLSRLGEALDARDERESSLGSEPLLELYNMRDKRSRPSRPTRYA